MQPSGRAVCWLIDWLILIIYKPINMQNSIVVGNKKMKKEVKMDKHFYRKERKVRSDKMYTMLESRSERRRNQIRTQEGPCWIRPMSHLVLHPVPTVANLVIGPPPSPVGQGIAASPFSKAVRAQPTHAGRLYHFNLWYRSGDSHVPLSRYVRNCLQ